MRRGAAALALLIAPALLAGTTRAETASTSAGPAELTRVVGGLEHPWGLAFLPDGRMLVTERPGRLRIVEGGRLSPPLGGVPAVYAEGQGGLLDVAASPDVAEDGLVYLAYAEPRGNGAATAVARGRLEGDRLRDVAVIWRMGRASAGGRHFGARLVFAPDGTLFIATGDRGQPDRAQDRADHAGKVLRINPDGSIPADNPFATGGGAPEVWSWGHRNIQGAGLDAEGRLWTVEHGARGGDEINRPEPGRNYGWPVISYGVNYDGSRIGTGTQAPGMEQPDFHWDPSIAPSGLVVYRGDAFPAWRGDILVGALRSQLVARVAMRDGRPTGEEERLLERRIGRVRDIREGPDGALWLLTDARDGALWRLAPAD
jgi:glucose/arabinose dehydrogenase